MKSHQSHKSIKALAIMLLFSTSIFAQFSCDYNLQLFDSAGDGWNDANLIVTINSIATGYSLNEDEAEASFDLTVNTGETIDLLFVSGMADAEITYFLYDSEGVLVFSAGPDPSVGIVFSGMAACPTCPPADSLSMMVDLSSTFTDLNWASSVDPNGVFLLEYGLEGFEMGTGVSLSTSETEIRLNNLQENTAYDVYVEIDCGAGDTSSVVGPFQFTTLWSNDVGISDIIAPVTSCDLENETVEVIIYNYGGAPQALIPFNFSVDGQPGGVSMPTDGLFTGVLSNDSTFTIEFETMASFAGGGPHILKAWTELEGDSDMENDTFTVVIGNNSIDNYPYFSDFELWNGGWSTGDIIPSSSWEFGEPSGTVIDMANDGLNIWATNLSGSYNEEQSYLISPCFDFSAALSDPIISFALNYDTEGATNGLWFETSTDGGTTWTTLGDASGSLGSNWYNTSLFAIGDAWSGQSEGWLDVEYTLTDFAGESDVRLRFVFNGSSGATNDGVGIDDITITAELPVATNQLELLDNIAVWPNPTSDKAMLQVNLNNSADVTVQVVNTVGQVIYQSESSNVDFAQYELDFRNYASGLYFARIQVDDNIYIEKIIRSK